MAYLGNFRNRESDDEDFDEKEEDEPSNTTSTSSKPISNYDLRKICKYQLKKKTLKNLI